MMTLEEINEYNQEREKFLEHGKKFNDACYKIISRISEEEDKLNKVLVNKLYTGDELLMHQESAFSPKCDFEFRLIGNNEIEAFNNWFHTHSYFDIKYLLMSDEEFENIFNNLNNTIETVDELINYLKSNFKGSSKINMTYFDLKGESHTRPILKSCIKEEGDHILINNTY